MFLMFGALAVILFVCLYLFVSNILVPARQRDQAAEKADVRRMDSISRLRRAGGALAPRADTLRR